MANILECDIVEREFEFQSRYSVHFRINNRMIKKAKNELPYYPSYGLSCTTNVFPH